MKMVFALAISTPLHDGGKQEIESMVDEITTTCSSSPSFIWPCPTRIRTSGTIRFNLSTTVPMSPMRLWMKKIWPPRFNSRMIPPNHLFIPAKNFSLDASPFRWRCFRLLISRTPTRAMCKVLGIGVADSVITSTLLCKVLRRSLTATPNLPSSTITSPRLLNFTS